MLLGSVWLRTIVSSPVRRPTFSTTSAMPGLRSDQPVVAIIRLALSVPSRLMARSIRRLARSC